MPSFIAETYFASAILALVLGALALPATAAVPAAGTCSTDAFKVKGTSLGVELCASATPAPRGKAAPAVTETLTVRGQAPLVRRITLDVVAPDEGSHTIDDAPLQSLGIAGTLHMTIGYKAGAVHLEHALLVPGAIALK